MQTARQLLNDEQVSSYERDGYLVVDGLLTEEEIRTFLDHVDRGGSRPDYGLHGHLQDDRYRYLATHPTIAGIAAQLLGGRPCVVQTMLLDKPPAVGKGIPLHQDLHYLPNDPETPDTLTACWLALSDTDADNGGLCVAPGSHTGGLRSVHRSQNAQDHENEFEAEYEMRDRAGREWTEKMYRFEIDDLAPDDVVHLTVPRGAGVFFNGRTIHGSYGNRSPDRPRRAFAVHYVREDTHVLRRDVQDTMQVDTPA